MSNIIVRETCSEMRAIARGALKGSWQTVAIGALLYYVMTATIPALLSEILPFGIQTYYYDYLDRYISVSYVSNLYSFVLTGAFSVGLASFILGFFRRKDSNPAHIFNGFEVFPKTFALFFMQSLFIFLWSLLLIVPGIIAAFRYSQAFIILADDPSKGVMQCIRESKMVMNGNKGRYFALLLSYIGWGILAVLPTSFLPIPGGILGIAADVIYNIPYFFLVAYLEMGRIVFYDLATGHLVARPEAEQEDNYYF